MKFYEKRISMYSGAISFLPSLKTWAGAMQQMALLHAKNVEIALKAFKVF